MPPLGYRYWDGSIAGYEGREETSQASQDPIDRGSYERSDPDSAREA